MNKLKLGSFFDGLGGWLRAAVASGVEPVWASEIDPYPAGVTAHWFPEVKQLGDITKLKADDLDYVDIICAGSPCLTADSLVLTMDGYKPIVDVKVGEMVLTKSNVWHKVAKKFDNGEHETCYISGTGFENIHCTPNHKFWARTYERKGHVGKRVFGEPKFVEAKDLTGKHYIGLPVIETEKAFYTEDKDFWWMIGYYLGDGWLAKGSNDIQLACNEAKLEKIKNHLPQEKYKYSVHDNGTCYRLRFSNKKIYSFISENIGTGCCEKNIPMSIVNLPKEQLMELYEGYLASDGCIVNGKHQFTSVNRKMIYELMLIINKLFHRWACVYKVKTKPTKVIEGRTVNQKDWYQIRFSPIGKKQDHSFVEDGYLWMAFRKREAAGIEKVYNMEIEEDHSYIVQGIISKNCQDLSLAGKRAGLGERGDSEEEATRSGLFRDAIDLVYGMRERSGGKYPRWFVWENVCGSFSSSHGRDFQAVLEEITKSEIPMPGSGKWARAGMVRVGECLVEWRVLNAQYFGVAQRRERVFLVCDFAASQRGRQQVLFEQQGVPRDFAPSGSKAKSSARKAGASPAKASKSLSFQERSGKPGGGKGILVQPERTGSLTVGGGQSVLPSDEDSP